mmetsp:Transcript_7040/g.9039  ORF Transcript_7040/g.9039 Transcript_7040/m.9039 type:complete len:196 (+) Transcript_7040:668-1255(+)
MLVPATPPPPDCPRCTEAEKYIFALEADIEYLRSVTLRNEFVCSRCENDDKSISSKSRNSHPKVSLSVSVGSTRKKREQTSGGGGASVSNSVISTQPKPESMSLAEASQRLVDVTARHKRQIEQMAKERVCAFIVSEVVFCFSFKRVCVMFCSVRIIYCHTQVCHFQAVLSVSGCSCVFSSLCRTCAASKLLRQE